MNSVEKLQIERRRNIVPWKTEMMKMKGKLFVALIVLVAVIICSLSCCFQNSNNGSGGTSGEYRHVDLTNLEQFNSYEEIEEFVQENRELSSGSGYSTSNLTSTQPRQDYPDDDGDWNSAPEPTADSLGDDDDDGSSEKSGGGSDYSTTNVQEKMVDEGDIMKNDAEFAYVVSSDNKKVVIMDVHPAEYAEIVSEIEIDEGSIIEIYLNSDKLVIVGSKGSYYYGDYEYGYGSRYFQEIFVYTYYIKDKDDPELYRNDTYRGSFVTSRMINEYLYLVSSMSQYQISNESQLPVPAHDVYYLDYYDNSYTYTTITSINVHTTMMMPNHLTILMGTSHNIYVSTNNIYLTKQMRLSWVEKKEMEIERVIIPILPDFYGWDINDTMNSDLSRKEKLDEVNDIVGEYLETLTQEEKDEFYAEWKQKEQEFNVEIAPDIEVTMIYRINIRNEWVFFRAMGSVPGYILNRFSMGEYDQHFRIATTTGHVSRSGVGDAKNHLFVLNMNLDETGSVRDIAPGERIYSARFMGKRAYLVTFDKVDPFFVIDVSDPNAPVILGELKIPGYSDYLHVYDENHVIGLGKDTVLADSGSFSWYQGVKLSLFEVTDVNNPQEVSKYIIGDRGTYSIAQHDSHAFLFSLSKNLLVLPISLYEIDRTQNPNPSANTHGEYVWEGAYVLDVDTDDGFQLRGTVSHSDDSGSGDNDYWYGWYRNDAIKRSFYIDDVLYTVSNSMLKANDLDTLEEITTIDLPYEEPDYDYYW
jgi:uncharacterized secreted protein with C-terminal beta-propeller domain